MLLTWHAFAQREVAIDGDHLYIRRWLDALTGRAGESVAIENISRAAFVVRSAGAKLQLETATKDWIISIWFWSKDDARALFDVLAGRGIATEWSIP